MARQVFRHSKKCFDIVGMAKKVFLHSGKSEIGAHHLLECISVLSGVAGITKQLFWHSGSEDSSPFSSDKIPTHLPKI